MSNVLLLCVQQKWHYLFEEEKTVSNCVSGLYYTNKKLHLIQIRKFVTTPKTHRPEDIPFMKNQRTESGNEKNKINRIFD